ncbi:unnamed protein product [Soboliphyme baturini]|uniref:WASH-7_N domain-containing protein n=1 Tax=Soboliphyme baturini TaxID=241478 RepID=A0A183J5D4_9BILA|nr:unnamed protein product [Soboliphyme baturini]
MGNFNTHIGEAVELMQKFKNFGIMFTGDLKFEEEMGRRVGVASGVLREFARTTVTKLEQCLNTKPSVLKSIFILILTYDWKVTAALRMPPREEGEATITCRADRQKAPGSAKINLFPTLAVFCRSSDSDTGSGTLEALSDVSASVTRREKRLRKVKVKSREVAGLNAYFWYIYSH